jgi:holo-ACP synthase/triphosphoribosyl-dephospho-CoA synthase
MTVTLEELLAERERRARRQKELLTEFVPGVASLVSLTLNIAGEEKAFPLAARCFHEEQRAVSLALEAEGIAVLYEEVTENNAGYAALLCIDAAPERVKGIAIALEDRHPLGRLFDIDVIAPDGVKLSRAKLGESGESGGGRKCLVCGKDAFLCARSRAHALSDVKAATRLIMENFLRIQLEGIIEKAASRALLSEVAVTPKPGLVDRANTGAHGDMDFFTFIDSAAAILPYFRDCAVQGFHSDTAPDALFDSLRPGGKIAETAMKHATHGVNTHKGAIFSFATLSAAFGSLFRETPSPSLREVAELTRRMCAHLFEDFADIPADTSHGKRLFMQHGITGIRGEAAAGFPSVCETAYPVMCRHLAAGASVNDAGVAAFLSLLARTEDTNCVHRAGLDELRRIQKEASSFLASNPPLPLIIDKARELDAHCIARHISPGGSADLLAVTFFLVFLLDKDVRHG